MAGVKKDQDLQKKEETETTSDATGIKLTQDNLSEIIDLLKPAIPEWEQFGHMLHISPVDINSIKKKIITQPSAKMTDVLELLWKKPELNWADIAKAVRKLGNHALADNLPQSGNAKEIGEDEFVGEMLTKLEEVIPNWDMFGMHMGIPHATLEAIESDLKPDKCFCRLLNIWMQRKGDKATTTELEKACSRIRNNALADEVKEWAKEQAAMDPK